MAPLYLFGKLTSLFFSIIFPHISIDPRLFFAPLYVTFLNTIFCAGSCAVFYRLGRYMRYSHRVSLGAVICLGFGTMLWPYSKFSYSEPQAAFFLLACFLYLFRYRQTGKARCCVYAGALLSLALITKYEVAFLAPAFLGYLLISLKDKKLKAALTLWGYSLEC